MELENDTAKQAYIQLLAEILKKKTEVLNKLTDLTQRQETVINSDSFNENSFNEIISLKEEQLKALSKLDDGFEQLYESVKEELTVNKNSYTAQISQLKDQITVITDYSVKLQTMESRNKAKLEALLTLKRKNIQKAKISSQTATNYYKTMAQQHEAQSFFYDKKN